MDSLFDIPRYHENPVLVLMEKYVLERIGWLSEPEKRDLEALNWVRILGTEVEDWQEAIRQFLSLSDTIDVTISEEWAIANNGQIGSHAWVHPMDFASSFADAYFDAENKLDDWSPASLRKAQRRARIRRMMDEN